MAETISPAPSLFFWLAERPPIGTRLLLTVAGDLSVEPLLEIELPAPTRAGIQRVRLEEKGVELVPGVEYEWTISLVADLENRANDVETRASVKRVSAVSGAEQSVNALAAQGLWYDAFAQSVDALEAAPSSRAAREARDALLRQAKLEAALRN